MSLTGVVLVRHAGVLRATAGLLAWGAVRLHQAMTTWNPGSPQLAREWAATLEERPTSRPPAGQKGRHFMREKLRPGEQFPDIELPNQDGAMTKLSGLMGGFPTVVVFSRGYY